MYFCIFFFDGSARFEVELLDLFWCWELCGQCKKLLKPDSELHELVVEFDLKKVFDIWIKDISD